jgi:hypothetical protein
MFVKQVGGSAFSPVLRPIHQPIRRHCRPSGNNTRRLFPKQHASARIAGRAVIRLFLWFAEKAKVRLFEAALSGSRRAQLSMPDLPHAFPPENPFCPVAGWAMLC